MRSEGLCATTLFDGATNGARFRAYVADTLVPALKPGDTVVLDNLQAHKVAGMRETIEAAGARLLYLPPYSPDFNPIKQIFAKLRLCSGQRRPAPSLICGTPSGRVWLASRQMSAATPLLPPATIPTWPSLRDRARL